MYELPESDLLEIKNRIKIFFKNRIFWGVFFLVVSGCIIIFTAGFVAIQYFPSEVNSFLQYVKVPLEFSKNINKPQANEYKSEVSYEQAIINAAKNTSPSVVSIVISKNVPIYEQQFINPFGESSPFDFQVPQYVQKGTELQEVGAGSGFIISADGLVLTNKHVVSDKKAEYTVYTNDAEKYTAKVLALDPVQDLAIIKIQTKLPAQAGLTAQGGFKPVILGDSSGIQIGQTVVAIGNALGQFNNTVSVGIVSGLGRTISASDQGNSFSETLEGIIQTDAAINSGNSGGPLLNTKGEAIGVNTATITSYENIGFAIPIHRVKLDMEEVKRFGRIRTPYLGLRYVILDDVLAKKYGIPVGYGAYVLKDSSGDGKGVEEGSPADKAGIKGGDVVLLCDGEMITSNRTLRDILFIKEIGKKLKMMVLRGEKEFETTIVLEEK